MPQSDHTVDALRMGIEALKRNNKVPHPYWWGDTALSSEAEMAKMLARAKHYDEMAVHRTRAGKPGRARYCKRRADWFRAKAVSIKIEMAL